MKRTMKKKHKKINEKNNEKERKIKKNKGNKQEFVCLFMVYYLLLSFCFFAFFFC